MEMLGTYYPDTYEFIEVNCPYCDLRLLLPIYVMIFTCPKCFKVCRLRKYIS